ncbi:MAG: M14 family zinc carboxypeptidase [Chromatiales bacterium]
MRAMQALVAIIGFGSIPFAALGETAAEPDLEYRVPIFAGANYDPDIPTLESLLGYSVGKRIAAPAEIEAVINAYAKASSRVAVFEYARSYEGRGLYYVAISTPDNIARLDEIRGGWAKIADPREIEPDDADELLQQLPAVAWMAYSIHGNETSGADAALALAYHLAAARDPEVEALLRDTVVLIDPMMNPDGRHRTSEQLAQHRGRQRNIDDQSLLHTGYWPWGRTNHYLFDLNRDWIYGVNPESRGRIAPSLGPWVERFAEDQARAFDANHWPYYTGEWNEGWYPGYSNAWAGLRGAVGMLYEQASVDEDGILRADGSVLTYSQAIHHQFVSSLANLQTLHANADQLKRNFLEIRRAAVSANGPYARRSFAILADGNQGRIERFVDLMQLQGIEVYRLTQPLMTRARDAARVRSAHAGGDTEKGAPRTTDAQRLATL